MILFFLCFRWTTMLSQKTRERTSLLSKRVFWHVCVYWELHNKRIWLHSPPIPPPNWNTRCNCQLVVSWKQNKIRLFLPSWFLFRVLYISFLFFFFAGHRQRGRVNQPKCFKRKKKWTRPWKKKLYFLLDSLFFFLSMNDENKRNISLLKHSEILSK